MMSRAVNQSPCCFDCRGRGAAAKKARRSEGREVGHSEVSGSRGSGEERPQSPRERRGSAENKLATASQVRCADCGGSNSHESDGFRLSSGREKLKSIREPIKTAEEKLAASAARVLRPNSQEPDGFRPSRSRSFGRSLPLILRLHFQQRACGASHSRSAAPHPSQPSLLPQSSDRELPNDNPAPLQGQEPQHSPPKSFQEPQKPQEELQNSPPKSLQELQKPQEELQKPQEELQKPQEELRELHGLLGNPSPELPLSPGASRRGSASVGTGFPETPISLN